MRNKLFVPFMLLGILVAMLAQCGATPEPTQPPPTQTPWIVVITATPEPGGDAEVEPSLTPLRITATPTRLAEISPTPSVEAGVNQTPLPTGRATSVSASGTSETPAATEVPATRAPTSTPAPEDLKYAAPVLLEPPDGTRISWKGNHLLEWGSVGELAEDEYYHLHLERPPQTDTAQWYGDYVFTKDTEYFIGGSFLAPFHPPEVQGDATVYWWVRVVQKTGEDESGKPTGVDVGEHSERRTLILEPKPED